MRRRNIPGLASVALALISVAVAELGAPAVVWIAVLMLGVGLALWAAVLGYSQLRRRETPENEHGSSTDIYQELGCFLAQAERLKRWLQREIRYQSGGGADYLLPYKDEPENLDDAVEEWRVSLFEYVTGAISEAEAEVLFSSAGQSESPKHPRSLRLQREVECRAVRLLKLMQRYEPNRHVNA